MLFYITFSIITVWLVVLGWYDCCYRRLPNVLTLGGAAVFLAYRFALGGIGGATSGLIGGLIGGAFLLIPFLMRGAGAGDVKMLCAVGILLGLEGILPALFLITVFGLLLGTGMLIVGKVSGARLKHYWKCCTRINYDRAANRAELPDKNKEAVRIPFGVAISSGTWIGLLLSVLAK